MSNSIVQADYHALEEVRQRFSRNAERAAALRSQVEKSANALRQGGWEGRGSSAFFAELDGVVLPAVQRLAAALQQGSVVTQQIATVMRTAEEEAAEPFRGHTSTVPGEVNAPSDGASSGDPAGEAAAPSFISSVLANVQKTLKLKSKGPVFDFGKGKFGLKPELGLDLFSGSLKNGQFGGGYGRWDLGGGLAGIGLKQIDGKWVLGAAGEVYAGRVKAEGTLAGDQNLGWTGGVEAKALSTKGFIGYYDGSVGGEVGVNLVSAKGETGLNIAGANVGVNAEIGLKLELGLSVGKNTTVKLGPLTFGISFGAAKPHVIHDPGENR